MNVNPRPFLCTVLDLRVNAVVRVALEAVQICLCRQRHIVYALESGQRRTHVDHERWTGNMLGSMSEYTTRIATFHALGAALHAVLREGSKQSW